VIVRRREHLRDHDADPIDQDDRRDGCRVSRLADAAKELPRSRANWKSQMSSVIAAIQHRPMPQRPNV
jgi:hypothetical protein